MFIFRKQFSADFVILVIYKYKGINSNLVYAYSANFLCTDMNENMDPRISDLLVCISIQVLDLQKLCGCSWQVNQ